ncbi:hypothetical protein HZS_7980, partial [Henneguya salminicola]
MFPPFAGWRFLMALTNYCMNFRLARNIIPSEVNKKLEGSYCGKKTYLKLDSVDDKYPINVTENGFSWANMGKRIIIWRHDIKAQNQDCNLYEIIIPNTFLTNSLFLNIFDKSETSKIVSVALVSILGEVRYWHNVRYACKYCETNINITPKLVANVTKFSNHEILVFLNDHSIVLLDITQDPIKQFEISTKSYIPKIISNIFSPFVRRSQSVGTTILSSFKEYHVCLYCLQYRIKLGEHNSVNRMKSPPSSYLPTCAANCPTLDEFLVTYADLRVFYLSTRSPDENCTQSIISKNTSFDVDPSITVKYAVRFKQFLNESIITNPLLWPEDQSSHFEIAFKKYLNKQKDLAITMVSNPISLSSLSEIVSKFSTSITFTYFQSIGGAEPKSMSRKLHKIYETNEHFISFLKDSGIWKQFYTQSNNNIIVNPVCIYVLKNIERSKLCLLSYQALDIHDIFSQSLIQLNSADSQHPNNSPNPINIHEIFSYVYRNVENSIKREPEEIARNILIHSNTFFIDCLDVFDKTVKELKFCSKGSITSLFELEGFSDTDEEWSLAIHSSVKEALLSDIVLTIKLTNSLNLDFENVGLLKLCNKYLAPIKYFSNILNSPHFFKGTFDIIIKNLERFGYIQPSIDLAANFLVFEDIVRLCIENERFDILNIYKNKWKKYDFDKIINEWLAKSKKWDLLAKEIDHENAAEICDKIPQLSWVYQIKANNQQLAKKSLKRVAREENNIFFKKVSILIFFIDQTYCSLYRMLELIDAEGFDPEICYYFDQIDYQQSSKKFSWCENINEILYPLEELLRFKLFNENAFIDIEHIIKSFNLVSQSNLCDLSQDLIPLIWAAVVLADPYLKQTDLVIESSCKKSSFFYECLNAVIENNFDPIFYPTHLCSDIQQFLFNHLEESIPKTFYDRMNTVFEVFQDS